MLDGLYSEYMEKGNLSNAATPRILLIAENALIYQVDDNEWRMHDVMVRRILWLFHKRDMRIEVVTYLGDSIAEWLAEWLDDEMVPVSRVWSTTPELLARNIAYMPDLQAIYDPEPQRWLSYGGKGRFIQDVNQLGE